VVAAVLVEVVAMVVGAVAVVAVVARQGLESYVGAHGPAGTAHLWVLMSAANPVRYKLTG
jgi:hypothetical protein